MHILGDHQPDTAAQTRQQIGLHRLRDQLVEFSALGSYLLVAGVCIDAQHRRQQRHSGPRIQPAGDNLGVQQSHPFGLISAAVDTAATLQQRAHRVQAGVDVKRRPGQLQNQRPGGLDQLGGRGRQAGLPNSGLAPEDHTGSTQRAGLRPRPGLFELRQLLGLALPPDLDGTYGRARAQSLRGNG